ncbi:hypothetical protein H6P81_020809 [Aristolochia fimbriata]|uniref:Uncharacterized protein n=1 Tax=Aristolochia fimbriata TaxID=158543 RepID=A0AAV7DVS0_ARIFI|nr:hypothetical protein H6P81_020809 [Aristolochia fimbriata]
MARNKTHLLLLLALLLLFSVAAAARRHPLAVPNDRADNIETDQAVYTHNVDVDEVCEGQGQSQDAHIDYIYTCGDRN